MQEHQLSAQQAIEVLYQFSRRAMLSADDHTVAHACREGLLKSCASPDTNTEHPSKKSDAIQNGHKVPS